MTTVIMATYKKRSIFLAGEICRHAKQLAQDALTKCQIPVADLDVADNAIRFSYDENCGVSPEKAANIIRLATSSILRKTYMELWNLPSLWTRRIFYAQSDELPNKQEAIAEYFKQINT